MPALTGQVIITLTNAAGAVAIVATWFFDPATRALRTGTYTTSQGDKIGALVADNLTGLTQRVAIRDSGGAELRSISVPVGATALSVAQLAAIGFTTADDFNGLTFDIT